jgi:hypothetical protein
MLFLAHLDRTETILSRIAKLASDAKYLSVANSTNPFLSGYTSRPAITDYLFSDSPVRSEAVTTLAPALPFQTGKLFMEFLRANHVPVDPLLDL